MKNDPADVLAAIKISRATVRKMQQNLFLGSDLQRGRDPGRGGVLYPASGLMLRSEFGALAMCVSSITVVSGVPHGRAPRWTEASTCSTATHIPDVFRVRL